MRLSRGDGSERLDVTLSKGLTVFTLPDPSDEGKGDGQEETGGSSEVHPEGLRESNAEAWSARRV